MVDSNVSALGIFGGTFDPVHNGHLRLAIEVREALSLQEVRMIPLRHPPHRRTPAASSPQRLTMLKAAIHNEPFLRLDRRELMRKGPSYTVDTLTSLRSELGATPLFLILGMDAFQSLPAWHRWEAVLDLAHIVVAARPEVSQSVPGELCSAMGSRLVKEPRGLSESPAGKILFQHVPILDISSSRIRAAVAHGRSVRYLVPDEVLRLIEKHHLYHAS
ncbi:MAG: nicotinate-nucleotide adenylyltransferase [Gammaproteobacteria bacterium]